MSSVVLPLLKNPPVFRNDGQCALGAGGNERATKQAGCRRMSETGPPAENRGTAARKINGPPLGGPSSLVPRAGIEPATPGFSVPPGRLPLTSARVRKQLHDSVSGSWKLPPMSAGVCHFPRDRHTFGTPFLAAHRGPR